MSRLFTMAKPKLTQRLTSPAQQDPTPWTWMPLVTLRMNGWIRGGVIHGALLHAKKYYKYDYPKSTATYGGGINDKRQIVGGYKATSGGQWFAFQATYK